MLCFWVIGCVATCTLMLSYTLAWQSLDAEINMNVTELITSKGYPCEEHEVVTDDGYILGLQRIPYGRHSSHSDTARPAVLLWHGILGCATNWVENLANQSLGFLLADAGYDVWLGNTRGSTYSRRHVEYRPTQRRFWAFSWDEMARYDVPASIEYILTVTGQPDLYYVGHSQGTLMAFVAFSTDQELGKKVKTFFALAPVTSIHYITSPIILVFPFTPLLRLLTTGEFLPNKLLMRFFASTLCVNDVSDIACESIMFMFGGYNHGQMNETRIPVYVGHNPAGTSIQTIEHYKQVYENNRFSSYDHGNAQVNYLVYGQQSPPSYDISTMETPVALFWGTRDTISHPADVELMIPKLKNVVLNKEIDHWMHLDFIWAMDAATLCYTDIINTIRLRENAVVPP